MNHWTTRAAMDLMEWERVYVNSNAVTAGNGKKK